MIGIALRIHLTANALFFLYTAVRFYPDGLAFGLLALPISLAMTSPALVFLALCLSAIKDYRVGLRAAWIFLIATAIGCAGIPSLIVYDRANWPQQLPLLFLSLAVVLGSLLLQSLSIHRHFKTLHYENN